MIQDDSTIIETRSLAEQVYLHLCNSIIEGKLNYGETINIKHLALELHVSPMPIREALKRMEVEGLVVIKPRSMCMLRVPTKKSVLDAIAMRELLETYCVENVYTNIEAESLEKLRDIIRIMKRLLEDGSFDIKKYIKYDGQFHISLCGLLANDYINKSYREINLHLNMNYLYNIGIMPDINRTYRDHVDLVDALESHSPKAVEIIEGHLGRSRKNVMRGKLFSPDGEEINP